MKQLDPIEEKKDDPNDEKESEHDYQEEAELIVQKDASNSTSSQNQSQDEMISTPKMHLLTD